jgi:PAS domain S-box-containing protein
MDWASVAKILSEQGERPLMLLDSAFRVRMVNRETEKAFGFDRAQVEGKVWSSVYVAREHAAEVRASLEAALHGTLPRQDVTVRTKAGNQVRVAFEFSSVGHGAHGGLLMIATRLTPVWQAGQGAQCDRDYEVSIAGSRFGSLAWVCSAGSLVQSWERDTRCYTLFHGLDRPCADCPVLRGEGRWPRTRVRHHAPPAKSASAPVFEVITVEEVDSTAVRVRVRHVDEAMLAAIQEAKLAWLADRAGLSKREREVFGHLVLGRGTDDIAQLVGISSRTVKHHQGSVLRKLGADSRADLMRIVF